MQTLGNTERLHFHKILIIDIETVPVQGNWEDLDEGLKAHWLQKMNFLKMSDEDRADPGRIFKDRAGIYAEFGKIICIGIGFIHQHKNDTVIRLKAFSSDDEAKLLSDFASLVNLFERQNGGLSFCGHNIKEFDIPYVCRRLLINGIDLPSCMDIAGLKPWQVNHQDTLELWRFGDYKNYTSLDLMAQILNVPSSKTDIDGSQVACTYWDENDLERITKYCLRDVYTTALVYMKLKGWKSDLPQAVFV